MMKEFREVIHHLSMLPYIEPDRDSYLKILDNKISAVKQQQSNISTHLEARLEKLLTLTKSLKNLPEELIHLLYNLEIFQENLDIQKMKAIVNKFKQIIEE